MKEEWTPQRIRALLAELDWTHARFAAELGIAERTFRECLQFGRVSKRVAAGLDRVAAAAAGECTGRCVKHCGGEAEDVNRGEFLGALSALGFGAFGLLGLSEVGGGDVGAGLYAMYAARPPGALLSHARIHAALHPSPDAYAFLGFLAKMVDARGESRAAFTMARDLAVESGDRRTQAQALLGLYTPFEGTSEGLPIAEEARRLTADADPWTQYYAELVLAIEHAHGGRGHAGACHGALARAERLLGATDPQAADGFYSPAGLFAGWSAHSLASETARCEVLLGDGRRAMAAIEEVDGMGGASTDRGKTMVVIRRGGAHRLLGEIDAAAVALAEGWSRADATGHGLAKVLVLEQRALLGEEHSRVDEVRGLDALIRG